jgi:WbqC-like protein family
MTAVILQSNYIPWKGYFDMMNMADTFIIYDEVQYTKNDWRNRNKIKTSNGLIWLTIPVKQEKLHQKINETFVLNDAWRKKHWNSIQLAYIKAPYFELYKEIFEDLYLNNTEQSLSKINFNFLVTIANILNIKTKIINSTELILGEGKTQRLVNLCKQVGANNYLSGAAAKDYLEVELFEQQKINVQWMDYSGYPIYNQLHNEFEHAVSILDLIFNEGQNSCKFMKSF